jgi:hypothetical protein
MKSRWNSLVVGSCNVFGLALLALSATAGGSAVRAGDPSVLESVVLEPFTKIVQGVEQRVADLEATIGALADSFSAKRVVAQQLCVADDGGAQTCITKAQLDALLKTAAHAGQTAAAVEPGLTEQAADKPVAPVAAVATPSETPPAIEPSGAALPIPPSQTEEGRVGEATVAMPEVAVVVPSDTEVTAGQPTAAASEARTPLAEATLSPPSTESVETVVAASAKPESQITTERPARDEEPAHAGSVETTAATPEVKTVPAEAPPDVAERLE